MSGNNTTFAASVAANAFGVDNGSENGSTEMGGDVGSQPQPPNMTNDCLLYHIHPHSGHAMFGWISGEHHSLCCVLER